MMSNQNKLIRYCTRRGYLEPYPDTESTTPASKYDIEIEGVLFDHYDLEDAKRVGKVYQVGDSAIEHAVKKLRAPGGRGQKDRVHDIEDAIWSLNKALKQIQRHEGVR